LHEVVLTDDRFALRERRLKESEPMIAVHILKAADSAKRRLKLTLKPKPTTRLKTVLQTG